MSPRRPAPRRTSRSLLVAFTSLSAAGLLLAGCTDRKANDALASDSALQKDLTLASQAPATVPELRDTAVPPPVAAAPAQARPRQSAPPPRPRVRAPERVATTPAPVQPEPVAPAPAPAPPRGMIASGTSLTLASDSRVCTGSAHPGDKIIAKTTQSVTGQNGAVIPAGTTVVLEVASVTPASGGAPSLELRGRSVSLDGNSLEVSGGVASDTPLERVRSNTGSSDKKKVIGGAIAGAVLGQIMGKSTKSTVIGAAAGAAAGTAAAAATSKYEGCLPAGATLHLVLNAPLTTAAR